MLRVFSDYLSGQTIDMKSFQSLYGLLYFNLKHQEEELKSGSAKLQLKYTLSGSPNAGYNLYALILHEEEISADDVFGKAVLRA